MKVVSMVTLIGSVGVALYALYVAIRTFLQVGQANSKPAPIKVMELQRPSPLALVRVDGQGMILVAIANNPLIPIYVPIEAYASEHEAMLAFNAAQEERQKAH